MLFLRKSHWPFCDYDVENECDFLLNRLVTVTTIMVAHAGQRMQTVR